MPAPRKYPDELRDRAVRLVAEDSEHGAIARVAARLDINPETLRNWVKRERRRVEQPETVDLEAPSTIAPGRRTDRKMTWHPRRTGTSRKLSCKLNKYAEVHNRVRGTT